MGAAAPRGPGSRRPPTAPPRRRQRRRRAGRAAAAAARSSCTAAPTTSTTTAPSAPAPASPPARAGSAGPARRGAAERGRSAAAVALGVSSPRHLSTGSLPLPGPQSLSLMVLWGTPNCPGWRGGERSDHPRNHLERRASPHTPAQVSRGSKSRPGASESALRCSRRPSPWAGHGAVTLGPRCPCTCGAPRPPGRLSGPRGCWGAGPLTSWGGCPASSPHTPLLGSHGRREVYPAVGPRL